MERSIKIRLIKKNANKVTIFLVGLNRKMIVPLDDYNKRVESGLYNVINLPQPSETTEAESA